MMWTFGPWGGVPWMWIFPLSFFGLVLFLFFGRSGRPVGCGHGEHKPAESARELLDRRYACGELNRDEYLQTKKDLE